jgi:integrase
VSLIDTAHVMRVIEPIWNDHRATAERVRGRIEKLLGFAAAKGLRDKDNPARWRGHLSEMLSSGKKKVQHFDAVPFAQCPALVAQLRALGTTEAKALEFLILCAARTNEVRFAKWNEIDLAKKIWMRPDERMKGRKAHTVPLCDRAVAILKSLPKSYADGFVFRRGDGVSPLGIGAMLDLLKEGLGLRATAHGFRASFSTWAEEHTAFPRPVVEAALAHAKGDAVEAAYNRSDLLDKRRKLMTAWANYLNKPPGKADNVVALHG